MAVAELDMHQIVVLKDAGSNPVGHTTAVIRAVQKQAFQACQMGSAPIPSTGRLPIINRIGMSEYRHFRCPAPLSPNGMAIAL